MIDLIGVSGYHTMFSMVLTFNRTPLPPGTLSPLLQLKWPRAPPGGTSVAVLRYRLLVPLDPRAGHVPDDRHAGADLQRLLQYRVSPVHVL